MKAPLIGCTLSDLEHICKDGNMPRFVAKQLASWLYDKRVTEFAQMTGISKKNQAWLAENYVIGRTTPASTIRSTDGTAKYLFTFPEGRNVESVYIPDRDRATLCVSSQAGCRMNCYFCATGRQGFKGNLTAAQIMDQILYLPHVKDDASASQSVDGITPLTNIVFMGMGEPLDNLTEVLKAIEIITAPWGMAWSPKRVTVSTVGKIDGLQRLLEETQVHVAVSVHSPLPQQRASMMPVERAYPIRDVMNLLRGYDFAHQRRLSLEYIMFRNVNDTIAHADELVALLSGTDARVNLIRFHAIPGVELVPSSEEKMTIFRNYLNSKGVLATIRASRGEDIMAACGMLAAKKPK